MYDMSSAEAAKRHGADCFGRGGKRKGWFLPIDNKGQEMTKQLPIDSEDVRKFPRSARKLTLSPKKKSSPRGGRRKSGDT